MQWDKNFLILETSAFMNIVEEIKPNKWNVK